jgi:predicted TIM-barrel fold metal-dependent hydrolase
VSTLAADEDTDREIWDGHVHLTGQSHLPNPPGTVEGRVDQLLKYADRVGVAKLVVHIGSVIVPNPSREAVRQRNGEVMKAVAYAPRRLLGFAYLNPQHGEECLRELDRCVRDGPMVGVKLLVEMRCNRPELDPLVRRAMELKAPILQHTYWNAAGNRPEESTPGELAALAARHPDASFICAHTGGEWERGIRALRTSNNVLAEISGGDPMAGFVEMAVRELGPERVSFGTDPGGRSFGSQLAKVYSADVSESAKRLILGGNLRRLLRPILAQKGMKL